MSDTTIFVEKLIYTWCITNERYGLTLPNIIGAIRTNTSDKMYSIANFFDEIPQLNLDIKISLCGDLEEFVFGTFKREDAPKIYYTEIDSVFYTKNELDILNYKDLVDFFEDKYSDYIDKELYSKDYYSKEWSNFTDEDRELFKEIKH